MQQYLAYFVRAAAVYIKKIDNCDLGSNQWNQCVPNILLLMSYGNYGSQI